YDLNEHDDLLLAYALTIHKSQGSEYPVVVVPVYDDIPMLTTRNLIYTAITRAKKTILLIGRWETFVRIVRNTTQNKRYTGLAERLNKKN
ncbi:MAG: ATP-binding domain-containing protein, partial [Oliverpabstia sp.]|nr:ATP-binding domain-containing protein [Oliverpabstia sp.]